MACRIQVTVSFEPDANIPAVQAEGFFKQCTQDLVETVLRLKAVVETVSPKPNLQLVYVSDIEHSTAFYKTIFNAEPIFASPRYVAFSAGGEVLFAIWSGGTKPDRAIPRFSEIGIMLPSGKDVDRCFEEWRKNPEIKIVQEPHTEVFGRTFLAEDPDGHIIRVCPLD
ncbi:VOC family protein [Xenorhabdus bovienii]|nr:VOC family protein [Xenorhabdus bovienii]